MDTDDQITTNLNTNKPGNKYTWIHIETGYKYAWIQITWIQIQQI